MQLAHRIHLLKDFILSSQPKFTRQGKNQSVENPYCLMQYMTIKILLGVSTFDNVQLHSNNARLLATNFFLIYLFMSFACTIK